MNLRPHLLERGYRVEVWTSTSFSDVSSEEVMGVPVRRFKSRFLSRKEREQAGSGKAPLSAALLRAFAAERGVDILHLHTNNRMSSLLGQVARMKRVPVVLTLHSEFRILRPRWRYSFVNELAIKSAAWVITVNESLGRSLFEIGVPAARVESIPNGVDGRLFSSGDGEAFRKRFGIGDRAVVFTPGRICDVKNQAIALEVLPLLEERVPDVVWVAMGPPSEAEYARTIERRRADAGLEDRLLMLPGVPPRSSELADAYAAADAVAVVSKHEGFPLVVLEAWAAGKPVVTTRTIGPTQMIRSEDEGILVDLEPRAIALALEAVLTDRARAASMAARGPERALDYSWEKAADSVARVYERVSGPAR